MMQPGGGDDLDRTTQLAAVLDLTRYYQPQHLGPGGYEVVGVNQHSQPLPASVQQYAAVAAVHQEPPMLLAQCPPHPRFTPVQPFTSWRQTSRPAKPMRAEFNGSSKAAAKKPGRWSKAWATNRGAPSSHSRRNRSRKRVLPPSPTYHRPPRGPKEPRRDDGHEGEARGDGRSTTNDIPSDFELVDEDGGSNYSAISGGLAEEEGDDEELEEGECPPTHDAEPTAPTTHADVKRAKRESACIDESAGSFENGPASRSSASLTLQLSALQRQLDAAVKALREEKSANVTLANRLGSVQSDRDELASRIGRGEEALAAAREQNSKQASQLEERQMAFQRSVKEHIDEMKATNREFQGAQRLLASERQRSGDLRKNLDGLKERYLHEIQRLRAEKEAAEGESATLRLRNDSMRHELSVNASIKAELIALQGKYQEAENELVTANKLIASLRSLNSLELQERMAETQATSHAEKQKIEAKLAASQQEVKELGQQLVETEMDVASVRCVLSNKERLLASTKLELDKKSLELGITRAELKVAKGELLEERTNSSAQELSIAREQLHHLSARCTELESDRGRLATENYELHTQLDATVADKLQLLAEHQRAANGQIALKAQNKKLSGENTGLKKRLKAVEEESGNWRGKYERVGAHVRDYQRAIKQRAELDHQFFDQLGVGDDPMTEIRGAPAGDNPATSKRTLSSVLLSNATNRPLPPDCASQVARGLSPIVNAPNTATTAQPGLLAPQPTATNAGKSKKRKGV